MAVFHLAAVREVAGVGEGRRYRSVRLECRIPAAVVEVEMGVDHDIDLLHADAGGSQRRRQKLLVAVDLAHLLRLLIADSGLDDYSMPARPYDHGIESEEDAVLLIRGHTLLP